MPDTATAQVAPRKVYARIISILGLKQLGS
jgi:hypothetical protein